jgi:SAM-dependent methyltransferase
MEAKRTECPLCGGSDGDPVWSENGHTARACACGVVCVVPPPGGKLTDESHAEGYYKYAARRRLAEILFVKRSGLLLDVGCGTGWFLRAAQAGGFEVHGLEPHAERAAVARSRGFEVYEALVEESALSPRYDVVFNTDLLSHFPDPVAALRAMADGLLPDGVICIEVGIIAGIKPGWYRIMGGLALQSHRRFYSQQGLEALFAKAGLEVRRVRRFGLAPAVLLVGLRKLLWPLLGKIVNGSVTATGKQGRMHSLYDWTQYVLRYRLGAWVPKIGPQTAIFILSKQA